MNGSIFFQVALIGLRLRRRYGIPRDVFTQLVWKWIPPPPPIENAPFMDVYMADRDPRYNEAFVGDYHTLWTTSNSTVTLSISNSTDYIPNACCFCEVQLEYEDICFVYSITEEEPVYYEVCRECNALAPDMGYRRERFG